MSRYFQVFITLLFSISIASASVEANKGLCTKYVANIIVAVDGMAKAATTALKGKLGIQSSYLPNFKPEGAFFDFAVRHMMSTNTAKYLGAAYAEAQAEYARGGNFVSALARAARVALISHAFINKIPKTGPFLVIANHPFGLDDGISIYEFVSRVRPDVMGLATKSVADFMPEFRSRMALVDLTEVDGKTVPNPGVALQMNTWLSEGRPICLFPAGATSKRVNLSDEHSVDLEWKDGAAAMAIKHNAPIIMFNVKGSNSKLTDFLMRIGGDIPLIARPWESWRRSELGFQVEVSDPVYPHMMALDVETEQRIARLDEKLRNKARRKAHTQKLRQIFEAFRATTSSRGILSVKRNAKSLNVVFERDENNKRWSDDDLDSLRLHFPYLGIVTSRYEGDALAFRIDFRLEYRSMLAHYAQKYGPEVATEKADNDFERISQQLYYELTQ